MKLTKKILSVIIVTTLACTVGITVFASSTNKQITVFYNNIKIYINENLFTPKDANGNILESFIYNGTTYLPVRAVSEALGNSVSWDGNTSSVYIENNNPSSPQLSNNENNKSVPTGQPSQEVNAISDSLSGMVWFYCFNNCIYKIVTDDYANIYIYDKSNISNEPIGNIYNPIYPSYDTNLLGTVYSINNMQNAVGTSSPQSIAIKYTTNSKDYYERADYFINGIITYNGITYIIAPITIGGGLLSDNFPYEVNNKIGVTKNGYDVYSYKNPPYTGTIAIDIPGMSCNLGYSSLLYPIAIPTLAITSKISSVITVNN
jgi:hypothetical protein